MKTKLLMIFTLFFLLSSCDKSDYLFREDKTDSNKLEVIKTNTIDWEEECPGDGEVNGGSGDAESGVYWYYENPAKILVNYSRNNYGGYQVSLSITPHYDLPNYSITDLRIDNYNIYHSQNSFQLGVFFSWTYVGSMGYDPFTNQEYRESGYASFTVDCSNL